MIHLNPKDHKIIQDILHKYPYQFYAYGSRVQGAHKKFSDLDICIMDDISDLDMFYIKDDFEASNLPFKIDLKRWSDMSKDFQSIIQPDLVLLKGDSSEK